MKSFLKIFLGLTIGQSVFAHSMESSPMKIQDATAAFLTFWESSKNLPPAKQIKNFNKEVVPKAPEYYQFKFKKWEKQGKNVDAELTKVFVEFKDIETSFRKNAKSLSADLNKNISTFMNSFSDFKPDFSIFVLHSLGEMDGGSREINGQSQAIFGVDNIAKFHNGTDSRAFFHHELFHFYHQNKSNVAAFEKLYQPLWMEGLATYVSEQLNPGSSEAELMLDVPEGTVTLIKAKLPDLLLGLQSELGHTIESENDPTYAKYFLLSSEDKLVPKRAGYYLGYIIIKNAAKGRSLKELAQMNKDEALIFLKSSLAELIKNNKK